MKNNNKNNDRQFLKNNKLQNQLRKSEVKHQIKNSNYGKKQYEEFLNSFLKENQNLEIEQFFTNFYLASEMDPNLKQYLNGREDLNNDSFNGNSEIERVANNFSRSGKIGKVFFAAAAAYIALNAMDKVKDFGVEAKNLKSLPLFNDSGIPKSFYNDKISVSSKIDLQQNLRQKNNGKNKRQLEKSDNGLIEAINNGDLDKAKSIINNAKKTDLNFQDDNGETALFAAINKKEYEIANLLIDKSINFNLHNNDDLSALDKIKSEEMVNDVLKLYQKMSSVLVSNRDIFLSIIEKQDDLEKIESFLKDNLIDIFDPYRISPKNYENNSILFKLYEKYIRSDKYGLKNILLSAEKSKRDNQEYLAKEHPQYKKLVDIIELAMKQYYPNDNQHEKRWKKFSDNVDVAGEVDSGGIMAGVGISILFIVAIVGGIIYRYNRELPRREVGVNNKKNLEFTLDHLPIFRGRLDIDNESFLRVTEEEKDGIKTIKFSSEDKILEDVLSNLFKQKIEALDESEQNKNRTASRKIKYKEVLRDYYDILIKNVEVDYQKYNKLANNEVKSTNKDTESKEEIVVNTKFNIGTVDEFNKEDGHKEIMDVQELLKQKRLEGSKNIVKEEEKETKEINLSPIFEQKSQFWQTCFNQENNDQLVEDLLKSLEEKKLELKPSKEDVKNFLDKIFAVKAKLTPNISKSDVKNIATQDIVPLIKDTFPVSKSLSTKEQERLIKELTDYKNISSNFLNLYLQFLVRNKFFENKEDRENLFAGFHNEIGNCEGGMINRLYQYIGTNLTAQIITDSLYKSIEPKVTNQDYKVHTIAFIQKYLLGQETTDVHAIDVANYLGDKKLKLLCEKTTTGNFVNELFEQEIKNYLNAILNISDDDLGKLSDKILNYSLKDNAYGTNLKELFKNFVNAISNVSTESKEKVQDGDEVLFDVPESIRGIMFDINKTTTGYTIPIFSQEERNEFIKEKGGINKVIEEATTEIINNIKNNINKLPYAEDAILISKDQKNNLDLLGELYFQLLANDVRNTLINQPSEFINKFQNLWDVKLEEKEGELDSILNLKTENKIPKLIRNYINDRLNGKKGIIDVVLEQQFAKDNWGIDLIKNNTDRFVIILNFIQHNENVAKILKEECGKALAESDPLYFIITTKLLGKQKLIDEVAKSDAGKIITDKFPGWNELDWKIKPNTQISLTGTNRVLNNGNVTRYN